MELHIPDLLDSLPQVDIPIQPHTTASTSRIKELTMEKIRKQGKYETKPRGLGFVGKLLIAAAIIAALAVPVMAVTGGWLTDWLAVTEDNQDSRNYDMDVVNGAGSKSWDITGWFVEMWGEEVTSTGMTLVCNEFSIEPHTDHLNTNEHYWIEKWNGNGYEKLEANVPEGASTEIQQGTTTRWAVDWSGTYGSLPSGYYRLAKTFTCSGENEGGESAVFYAKFRIFTEEMEPYIRRCNDALAELLASDSWHMTWTDYPIYHYDTFYDRSVMEIWKSGEDYLFMDTVYYQDGSVHTRHGSMLRDGRGYAGIQWAGDTVDSDILEWETADYVDHSNFDLWPQSMNIWESIVGQVCDNGNQIIAIEYLAPLNGESDMTKDEILAIAPLAFHDYTEKTFTFDENGDLLRIHATVQTAPDVPDGEKVLYQILEVHDTPADEIANRIAKQSLNTLKTFDFELDYALYKDMGKLDGFINTQASPISTADAAIDRARLETDPKKDPQYRDGYIYNCAEAFYDAEAEMWKVDFWHSQDTQEKNFRQIVYLDKNGVTKLIVWPASPEGASGNFLWENDFAEFGEKAQQDGFRNTSIFPVTCPEDAILLAQQEADPKEHPNYKEGLSFDVVWGVYYDEAADLWKVIMWSKETPSFCCMVYLDSDGLTRMIYYDAG